MGLTNSTENRATQTKTLMKNSAAQTGNLSIPLAKEMYREAITWASNEAADQVAKKLTPQEIQTITGQELRQKLKQEYEENPMKYGRHVPNFHIYEEMPNGEYITI